MLFGDKCIECYLVISWIYIKVIFVVGGTLVVIGIVITRTLAEHIEDRKYTTLYDATARYW